MINRIQEILVARVEYPNDAADAPTTIRPAAGVEPKSRVKERLSTFMAEHAGGYLLAAFALGLMVGYRVKK